MVQVPFSSSTINHIPNQDLKSQEPTRKTAARKERDPVSSTSTNSSNSSTDTDSHSNISISTLIPSTNTFPELTTSTSPTAFEESQYDEEESQNAQGLRELQDQQQQSHSEELLGSFGMKRECSTSSEYYSPSVELKDESDYFNSNSVGGKLAEAQQSSLDRSSSLGSESVASSSSIHHNNYAYNSDSITSHSHSNSNSSDISSSKLHRNPSTKSRTSSGLGRVGSLKRSAIKHSTSNSNPTSISSPIASIHSGSNSSSSSNINSTQKKELQKLALGNGNEADSSSALTSSLPTSSSDSAEDLEEAKAFVEDLDRSGTPLSKSALEKLMERDRKEQEQLREAQRAIQAGRSSERPTSFSDSFTNRSSSFHDRIPTGNMGRIPSTPSRRESLLLREDLDDELGLRFSFDNPPVRSSSKVFDFSQTNDSEVTNRELGSNSLSSPSTNKLLPLPPVRAPSLAPSTSSNSSIFLSPNRNKPLPELEGELSPPFVTPPDSNNNSAPSSANQSRETLSAFSTIGGLGVTSAAPRASAAPALSVSPAADTGSAWPSPASDLTPENSPHSSSGFRSAISRSGKAFKKSLIWTGNVGVQSGAAVGLSPALASRSPAPSSSAWSSQLNSPASRNSSSRAPTPDPNESQASIASPSSRGSTNDLGSVDENGARISYGIAKGQMTPSLEESVVQAQNQLPPRSHSPFGFFRPQSRTSNRSGGGVPGLQKLTSAATQSSPAESPRSTGSFSTKQRFLKEKTSAGINHERSSSQSTRPALGLTSLPPHRPTLVQQDSSNSTNTINTDASDSSSTGESGGKGANRASAWNRWNSSTVRERSHRLSMSLLEAASTPLMSPQSAALGLPPISPQTKAVMETSPTASLESKLSQPSRPALRRHRSKSVDHLQKAYAGNRAQEEVEPVALAAGKVSQQVRVNSIGKGNRRTTSTMVNAPEKKIEELGSTLKESRNSSGKSSIYTGRSGLDLDDQIDSTRGNTSFKEVEKELGVVTKDSAYYSSLASSGSGSRNGWSKNLHARRSSGIPSLIRPEKASAVSSADKAPPKAAFSRMTTSFKNRRTSLYGGNKLQGLTPDDSSLHLSGPGLKASTSNTSQGSSNAALSLSAKSRESAEQPDSPGLENLAAVAQLSSDLLALYDQEDVLVEADSFSRKEEGKDGLGLVKEEGTVEEPPSRPPSVKSGHSRRASLGRTLSSLFDPIQPKMKSSIPPSPKFSNLNERELSPSSSRPGTSLGFIRNIRRRSSISSNADDTLSETLAAQLPLPARTPAPVPTSSRSRLPIRKITPLAPPPAAETSKPTPAKRSPPGTAKGHKRSSSSPLLNNPLTNQSPKSLLSSSAGKQSKISSSASADQIRGSSPASASPQRYPPSSYRGQASTSRKTGNGAVVSPSNSAKELKPSSSSSSSSSSSNPASTFASKRERGIDYSKAKGAAASTPPKKSKATAASRSAKLRSKSTPINMVSSSAVSDTEDDPLPPPRSSSRQGFSRKKSEGLLSFSSRAQTQRSRTSSGGSLDAASRLANQKRRSDRPSLTLDTRPSTSQGMHRVGSIGGVSPSAGSKGQGKLSQQALSIVDDVEFLRALETVRSLHKQQMAQQEAESFKIERMAKLGMASGKRERSREVAQGSVEASDAVSSGSNTNQAQVSRDRHARTSSADARLGGKSKIEARAELLGSQTTSLNRDNLLAGDSTPDAKATALTLREGLAAEMGQAAGSDEDWKKEVKALFIIRELVQTELSYQRHLESLIAAVRAISVSTSSHTSPVSSRRKSGSGLSALTSASSAKSSSAITPAAHIKALRNLLPQLIALSRSLTSRIVENSTAAGVGAAFRVVSPQLEATFVAWSSQIDSIMAGLRAAEGGKGKAQRLGLIPILPVADSEGAEISLSSEDHNTIEALSLTRPSSPIQQVASTPGSRSSRAWTGKRRSTISNADHYQQIIRSSVFESPISANESSSNSEAEKQVSKSTVPSRSSSPWGWNGPSSQPSSIGKKSGSAYKPTNASRSKSYNQLPTSPQSTISALPSVSTNPTSNNNSIIRTGTKSLSPLDIAIMPTQRVPRYVLLLRDLIRNTPQQSISYDRVQKALDQLQTTAALCDQASGLGVVQPHLLTKSLSRPTTPGLKPQRWNAWT